MSSGCLQLRLTTIPPNEVIARLSASESGHGWHRTASLLPRSAPCCSSSATADSTSSANDSNDTADGPERDDQTSRKGWPPQRCRPASARSASVPGAPRSTIRDAIGVG